MCVRDLNKCVCGLPYVYDDRVCVCVCALCSLCISAHV